MRSPDLGDGRLDAFGYRRTRAFGVGAAESVTAAEPDCGRQLAADEVHLRACAFGASEVVGLFRFVQLVAQFGEPQFVAGLRRTVQRCECGLWISDCGVEACSAIRIPQSAIDQVERQEL